MKAFKRWVGAVSLIGAALLLASCGGGGGEAASSNPKGFTKMVSFGDSLSDTGAFAVGTVAALGGGRYTVNSGSATAPTKIWVDLLSQQMGLPVPCSATTGLNSRAPFGAPVAVVNYPNCFNFAQGGSRVSAPIGPANTALPDSAGGAVGQLTYPVTQQITNYLAANSNTFTTNTLVTVLAGGNDIFMNGNGVSSAAAGGSGAVGAGVVAGWTNGADALATTLGLGGTTATNAAITQAVTTMSAAGTRMANEIINNIIGRGARYVVVVNLPDVSSTPYGLENPTAAPLVLQMVQAYNASLQAGLAGRSEVIIVDAYTSSRDQFVNPANYGLTNSTNRSCSTSTAVNPLGGASLVCNVNNTIAGDVSRYAFADDVHPTPYGHQLLGQLVGRAMQIAGWL
jgi:outer membrane lipase/esterase